MDVSLTLVVFDFWPLNSKSPPAARSNLRRGRWLRMLLTSRCYQAAKTGSKEGQVTKHDSSRGHLCREHDNMAVSLYRVFETFEDNAALE